MPSEAEGLRTVADVVSLLETHGIEVTSTDDCRTAPGGDRVRARLDIDAPVDVFDEDATAECDSDSESEVGLAAAAAQEFHERITTATGRTSADPDTGSDVNVDDIDLTPGRQEIVDELAVAGELPSTDVKDRTGQSGAHHTLGVLVDEGVVKRRKDPDDGRRQLYSLTARGERLATVDDQDEQDRDQPNHGDDPLAGLDRDELVDALEGAQSIHHVARDLGVERGRAEAIVEEIGIAEDLRDGTPALSLKDAEGLARRVV